MWSHLYACHRNAVWLINQDVEPTLLAFRESAASAVRASSRCAVIDAICYAYGDRLLISVKACRTVDDADDIILVDLTQYLGVTRGVNIHTDVSMHLFSDAGALAYRFVCSVGACLGRQRRLCLSTTTSSGARQWLWRSVQVSDSNKPSSERFDQH